MNDLTTSTIADSVGVNDGTKTGANEPVVADGGIGKAQNFDGSNDLVSRAHNAGIIITNDMTIEAYVYTDTQVDYAGVVEKGEAGGGNYLIRLNPSAKFLFRIQCVSGHFPEAQSAAVTLNAWNYLAGVYNRTNVLLYTNSTLVTGTADTHDAVNINIPMEIGHQPSDAGRYFDGKITEVRLSQIARSAAYIKANNYCFTDSLVTFGAETEIVVAADFLVRLNHWPHNFKNAM
jgi:hypothetical protein